MEVRRKWQTDRLIEKWPYGGKSIGTSSQKGKKKKETWKHMKKMYIFSVCDIKQSYSAGSETDTQSQTTARGWTISLVPLSRAHEESMLWASLLAERIQQANDIQTSLLRPWTGPSFVCARYKPLWFGEEPNVSISIIQCWHVCGLMQICVCAHSANMNVQSSGTCRLVCVSALTCCWHVLLQLSRNRGVLWMIKCWWKTTKTSFCLSILLKDAVLTPVTFESGPDQHHITINLPRSEQMMEYIRQQGKMYTTAEPKNFLCYRHIIQYRGEQNRGLNASLKKNDVLKTRRDVFCQCKLFQKACRTSSEKFKKQHIKIKWLYNCNIVEWR